MSVSTISSIAFAITLVCERSTPLEAPVVPPVYSITAGEFGTTATSGVEGGPRNASKPGPSVTRCVTAGALPLSIRSCTLPANSRSASTTFARLSLSPCSSSAGDQRQLSGAATAPAAIAPRMVSALKMPFPQRMATVSPGRTPSRASPLATDHDRSTNSRWFSRRLSSTTALDPGRRP